MSAPQLQFDADAARRIEALYHIRDAVHRRELVREALGAVVGDRILDVGCGPGFYCLELSEIVGSSGSVVGVDSSPAMLQLARARCAGRDNVGLLEGEATALPVESGTFDGAVCVRFSSTSRTWMQLSPNCTGPFDRADVQSSGTWTGRRCRFTRETPL